jgi:hypothetical protein
MTDEESRTAGQGDSAQRGPEPLIVGIREGVEAGYQALEYVLAGLRESVRIRRPTWTGSTKERLDWAQRQGAHARGTTDSGRHPLRDFVGEGAPFELDYLVRMLADLLGSASGVAQEFARYISERSEQEPAHPKAPAQLEPKGFPDSNASCQFRVHNTTSTALRDVVFAGTELIGDEAAVQTSLISFEPDHISSIRPGGSVTTTVTVAIPRGFPRDTYRGLILAEPGDAWAVLELTVLEPTPEKDESATAAEEGESATAA